MSTAKQFFIIVLVAVALSICSILAATNISSGDKDRLDLALKGVAGSFVVVSFFVTALTYYKNSHYEKSKWLNQLYEKFFETSVYSDIRELLDYNSSPNEKYARLKDIIERKSDSESKLQEQLVVYLNFFEYIATLWKTGQISERDVHMMFGYYIKNLEKHGWLMDFAKQNEFKNLPRLIAAVKTQE